MSEKDPSVSGLNLYGVEPSQVQDYINAREAALKALEQRYESPNWFNVAAGFFKPQLGGFAASLGSAGQALGDWQEKQRENVLPAAKMRAELALSKIALEQKLKAADVTKRSISGGPLPRAQDVAEVTAYGGNAAPTAQALSGAVGQTQRQQELDVAAQTANQERFDSEKNTMMELAKREDWPPAKQAAAIRTLEAKYKSLNTPTVPIKPNAAAPVAALTPPPAEMPTELARPSTFEGGASDAAFNAAMAGRKAPAPAPAAGVAALTFGDSKAKPSMEDWLARNPGKDDRDYDNAMKARAQEPMRVQATAPAAGEGGVKTTYKANPAYLLPHRNENDAEQAKANAVASETIKLENDRAVRSFAPYRTLAEPAVKSTVTSAFNGIKKLHDNPATATVIDKINDAVRSAGVLSTVANTGITVGALGYSMQLSVPMQQALMANMTKAERAIASPYIDHLSRIAAADIIAQGRVPTDADIIETAKLSKPFTAQFNAVERAQQRFNHALKANDVIQKELPAAMKTGSKAPYAEVNEQSNELRVLNRMLDKRLEAINSNETSTAGRKKP